MCVHSTTWLPYSNSYRACLDSHWLKLLAGLKKGNKSSSLSIPKRFPLWLKPSNRRGYLLSLFRKTLVRSHQVIPETPARHSLCPPQIRHWTGHCQFIWGVCPDIACHPEGERAFDLTWWRQWRDTFKSWAVRGMVSWVRAWALGVRLSKHESVLSVTGWG